MPVLSGARYDRDRDSDWASHMLTTRVLLADDHAMVAQGLGSLLQKSFDLVGVVHDGHALVDAAGKLRPDVIVTDISMPGLNGLEAIRQIRARRPGTKIVVLTMHRDKQLAVEAFRAGASGYVLKVSPAEESHPRHRRGCRRTRVRYHAACQGSDYDSVGSARRSRWRTSHAAAARSSAVDCRGPHDEGSRLHFEHFAADRGIPQIREQQVLGVETTAALIYYAIRLKLVAE